MSGIYVQIAVAVGISFKAAYKICICCTAVYLGKSVIGKFVKNLYISYTVHVYVGGIAGGINVKAAIVCPYINFYVNKRNKDSNCKYK